ncbi:MAG: hypothetical protein MMC23_005731 [Stictis urceolatum]|nr:hypothetical protein [Stictis urceolata]
MAANNNYDDLLVQIVDYIFDYDIPQDADCLRPARLCFLDAVGCAAESIATNKDVRTLIGPYVPGTTVPNGFRLPGTSFALDPVKGAFDYSVLIRYLDHNDGFTGLEWGHPSDVLGAICAVADYMSRSGQNSPTIHTILTCIVKSYEIQGRLQLLTSLNQRGLDHVFFEQLAACAVISGPDMLNLSKSQALSALSHCILDNAPLRAYRQAPNTIPRKGWAAASATSRAVQLAFLAKAGQAGAPKALSAERWGFEDAVLGQSRGKEAVPAYGGSKRLEFGGRDDRLGIYAIHYVFHKLMPCEGHSLTAVEACVRIREDLEARGIAWDVQNVKKVSIRTHHGAILIISKPAAQKLVNPADRDHCLEFILTVTLLKGEPPEYADYADDAIWATDERVDLLRGKMVVTEDERFSRDYHDVSIRSMASGVRVELANGVETDEVVIEHAIGSPMNKRTGEAVLRKVDRHLKMVYDATTIANLTATVENSANTPAKALFNMLWKGEEEIQNA